MATADELADYYSLKGTDPLDQVDAVVVNGAGIISHYPVAELNPWRAIAPSETGWFYEEWGEDTLAAFLFRLSQLISPRTEISGSILSRYLSGLKAKKIHLFAATVD